LSPLALLARIRFPNEYLGRRLILRRGGNVIADSR
jgi:hypothetical protein